MRDLQHKLISHGAGQTEQQHELHAVLQSYVPVSVLSSVKPSRFHSFTVLSAEAVASWRTSGLSKHFSTYLPVAHTCV